MKIEETDVPLPSTWVESIKGQEWYKRYQDGVTHISKQNDGYRVRVYKRDQYSQTKLAKQRRGLKTLEKAIEIAEPKDGM